MITGDYPATARAIARQAGIDGVGRSRLLDSGSHDLATKAMANCAAASAHPYLRPRAARAEASKLVSALKANGKMVAMTGDGVNDAPALKAAQYRNRHGRARHGRGARGGRRSCFSTMTSNRSLRRFEWAGGYSIICARRCAYILAVHVPIAGLALVPLLLGWPIVFFPVHIVFLELIIDPACSIAFEAEPEEPDTMQRGPRPFVGISRSSAATSSWAWHREPWDSSGFLPCMRLCSPAASPKRRHARLLLQALVAVNIALILANRSRWESLWGSLARRNPFLWWVVGAAIAVLLLAIYAPPVSELFRFAPLGAGQLLLSLAPAIFMLAATEVAEIHAPAGTRPPLGCRTRFIPLKPLTEIP